MDGLLGYLARLFEQTALQEYLIICSQVRLVEFNWKVFMTFSDRIYLEG